MKNKFLISIAFIIWISILSSCRSKIDYTITGWWTIDSIIFKGNDIRYCLLSNSIDFNQSDCKLPITENFCNGIVESWERKGNWNTFSNDNSMFNIDIQSKNVIFNGRHRIVFYKNETQKLLMMEFISNDLTMVCRKGLYDYDRNIKTINYLIEKSKRKP